MELKIKDLKTLQNLVAYVQRNLHGAGVEVNSKTGEVLIKTNLMVDDDMNLVDARQANTLEIDVSFDGFSETIHDVVKKLLKATGAKVKWRILTKNDPLGSSAIVEFAGPRSELFLIERHMYRLKHGLISST